MSKLKKEGLKIMEDLSQTKGHPPKGIRVEVWNKLVDYWLSEKYKKKSSAAKTNRMALLDASLHSGGSISFGEHKRRMEKQKQCDVSMRDMYLHTHKRKGIDKFVSERTQEFMDKFDAGLVREFGDNPSQYLLVDPTIWLEASDSYKKGWVHGLGCSLTLSAASSNCTTGLGTSG